MKYWRGYLVAAIIAACSWGLREFAKGHSELVDMIYPYATRLVQNFLTGWSGTVEFCLWQVLLVAFGVLVLASVVLMVVLKWNPIQWFGWVLAVASVALLLNTGIYGLNEFAGPIAEDIRLKETEYTVTELEEAAIFYRNKANTLAKELGQNRMTDDLGEINAQAGNGFEYMKTQEYQSIFAGNTDPVKVLDWAGLFTQRGVDGVMVGITGEAAVNPETPTPALPLAVSELMAKRMCIAKDADAKFAAFLACRANEDARFQYAAYLSAYRACCDLLDELDKSTGENHAQTVRSKANANLSEDAALLNEFYKNADKTYTEDLVRLLVSLHIQEEVLPLLIEEEVLFDPLDETQVDLSGIVNAGA